jgi:hypothetical protein
MSDIAIKLNYINTRINTAVAPRGPRNLRCTCVCVCVCVCVHVYHLPFRLHSTLRTSN